jgi:hypothetical protein
MKVKVPSDPTTIVEGPLPSGEPETGDRSGGAGVRGRPPALRTPPRISAWSIGSVANTLLEGVWITSIAMAVTGRGRVAVDTFYVEQVTLIKLHLRVRKRTDASGPVVRILMLRNWGSGRVGSGDYQAKPDQVGMAGL